ncbi:hypothetical protein DRN72_04810 [Methanosarcinales archaeon]|nr:MAG: hypothetical protein DRN72_04810 [Methanosarcinales archaeon]
MGILDKLSKLIPKKEKELEFDVSPEEMGEIPGDIFGDEFEIEEGGLGEIQEEGSGGGRGEERFEELESKISKLEMTITGMQREQDEVKKSLESINQSMVELLSLYEVVSNQINPFVGDGDKAPIVMERLDNMEKRINEFEKTINNIKIDLETKSTEDKSLEFDTLSEAFGTLSEEVDKLSKKISEIEVKIKSEKIEGKEVKREKENVKENIVTADSVVDYGEGSKTSTKPRLKRIELTPTNVVVLLKWLEFLMERVGRNNLIEVLDFYVEIGWISEEVASTLLSYARGIEYYTEKHEWRLLSDDHTKSLLFIEKLSGNKIDHSTLRRVEREISKLSRGVEEIYGL